MDSFFDRPRGRGIEGGFGCWQKFSVLSFRAQLEYLLHHNYHYDPHDTYAIVISSSLSGPKGSGPSGLNAFRSARMDAVWRLYIVNDVCFDVRKDLKDDHVEFLVRWTQHLQCLARNESSLLLSWTE